MIRMSARQYSLAHYLANLKTRIMDIDMISALNQTTLGSFKKRGWIKERDNKRSIEWTREGVDAYRKFHQEDGFWRLHASLKFSRELSLETYDSDKATVRQILAVKRKSA